jgi:hypothetical protein
MIASILGLSLFLLPGFFMSQKYFQDATFLVRIIMTIGMSFLLYIVIVVLIAGIANTAVFTLSILCSGIVFFILHRLRWK